MRQSYGSARRFDDAFEIVGTHQLEQFAPPLPADRSEMLVIFGLRTWASARRRWFRRRYGKAERSLRTVQCGKRLSAWCAC
jgi:hypothetical protein